MKSSDETKKGLEEEIPVHYHIDGEPRLTPRLLMGMQWLHKDAIALIQQKEQENAEQAERIRQLEAERDAAVKCIKDVCGCMACNSARVSKLDSPCRECICDGMVTYDYWLWRGVQKEG